MPERPDIVDVAAGTGKLTRTLAELAGTLVAVEPDAALRAVLERELPAVTVLEGTAEALPLPTAERRAVCAGQAFHWFDVDRALDEFARVLRRRRHCDRGLEHAARGRHLVRRGHRLPQGREPRPPARHRRRLGRGVSARTRLYGGLVEIAARHEQPTTRAAFRRLLGTHSAINVLPAERRSELIEQALAVADAQGAFDADGQLRDPVALRAVRRCSAGADEACAGARRRRATLCLSRKLHCLYGNKELMVLPARTKYLVVGAGLHGLSTAYHLGKELAARGTGSGADIVILEKSHPGAGASGIACGVVRNNYFQPAMQELMQACVEVWESDPAAYSYNPVGYMAIGPQVQEADLTAVYERQQKIGYDSTFVTGEAACDAYMKKLFPDWRAQRRDGRPARAQGRLRAQPRLGRRDAGQGRVDRRQADHGRRGHGLRARGRRLGARGRDEPGPHRVRSADRRPRPVGQAPLGHARAAADDRRAPAERRRRARSADVDVLEPAGGRDLGRPQAVLARGRLDAARRPPRHRRAAATPTTASSSPTSCGASTTSRTATASRAARRRSRSGPRRRSTPIRSRPTSIPSSPTCGARRSRTR